MNKQGVHSFFENSIWYLAERPNWHITNLTQILRPSELRQPVFVSFVHMSLALVVCCLT